MPATAISRVKTESVAVMKWVFGDDAGRGAPPATVWSGTLQPRSQRGVEDVLKLKLHRGAGVEMEGENPLLGTFGGFIGDIDGGLAVDEQLDVVVFDD